jgi:hypothetical protein
VDKFCPEERWMTNGPWASSNYVWLNTREDRLPVCVQVGQPVNTPDGLWSVSVALTVGETRSVRELLGADSLSALLNGLIDAAAEVNKLRRRGRISYEGRRDDYFCLDELLRTPATGGYLPGGGDRPSAEQPGT